MWSVSSVTRWNVSAAARPGSPFRRASFASCWTLAVYRSRSAVWKQSRMIPLSYADQIVEGSFANSSGFEFFDTGIELEQARGTRVLHNTVMHSANAFASILPLEAERDRRHRPGHRVRRRRRRHRRRSARPGPSRHRRGVSGAGPRARNIHMRAIPTAILQAAPRLFWDV